MEKDDQDSLKECADQCVGTHRQILYGKGNKDGKCYCYMPKSGEQKQCKGGKLRWKSDDKWIQYAFNEPG